MLSSVALVLLFANAAQAEEAPAVPQSDATLPRRIDDETLLKQENRGGKPTDPWFDRDFVATDDPAFIITAIDSGRQGMADARAYGAAATPELTGLAQKIERHSRETTGHLESLASRKGWRVPADNPQRAPSVAQAGPSRTRANYIINQIAYHQSTVEFYRAQIAGKGDAELKRTLRTALPGYEKNLRTLLELKSTPVAAAQ